MTTSTTQFWIAEAIGASTSPKSRESYFQLPTTVPLLGLQQARFILMHIPPASFSYLNRPGLRTFPRRSSWESLLSLTENYCTSHLRCLPSASHLHCQQAHTVQLLAHAMRESIIKTD